MTDTILFDLDGTLLRFGQDAFIAAYFAELSKVFVRLGLDPPRAIKATWAGTRAMVTNDGGALNRQRFWDAFAAYLSLSGAQTAAAEAACDRFYANEFDAVRSVLRPSDIPRRLVHALKERGYGVALATNPLFPACAVETRLHWTGLTSDDFKLVTHYANSTYCKPNPGYYRELFTKLGKAPENCLMIGNSPSEDMVAGTLGAAAFLVTDCLENESGADITAYHHGSLAELETFLIG